MAKLKAPKAKKGKLSSRARGNAVAGMNRMFRAIAGGSSPRAAAASTQSATGT